MDIIFEKIPQNLNELKSTPYSSLEKPEYAAALFIACMTVFPKDREACFEMINYLKGPESLNNYNKQFLTDRMRDADYLPWSFFNGTSPENNYTPTTPYTVTVTRNPYSVIRDDYIKLFIKSSGADSARPIETRLKKSTGQFFVVNQLLLSGIRKPVEDDPWA